MIVEMKGNGLGLHEIAKELARKGVKMGNGSAWTALDVRRLLDGTK